MGDHIIRRLTRIVSKDVARQRLTRARIFAMLVTVSCALTSCGVSVKDAKSQNGGTSLGLSSAGGCLDQALPSIQRYFQAQSSPEEVEQTWQCFASNLQTFSTYITPENPQYYTKEELKGFLVKFVMGSSPLSDEMMTQIMKVKQVILGGTNDTITRDELARVQQIILTLQSQSINLLPHLRVLFMLETRPGQVSSDDVASAQAAMSQFVEALGAYLKTAAVTYDVQSAQALLAEFDRLYAPATGWTGPKKIINYLDSFPAFKSFLATAPGNTVSAPEWISLFHQLTDAYAIYLRYHYLIDSEQMITTDPNISQWSMIAGQLRDLLNTAVTSKANGVIDYATLDALVHEVYRLKFFTVPLTETTLKGALRPALGVILNPVQNGVRPRVTGITTATLNYILKNVQAMLEMQSLYVQAVDKAGNASHVTYQTLRQIWPTLAHNSTDAWRQMQSLINARFPLYVSNEEKLEYDFGVMNDTISADHYFALNWQRAGVSALIAGYSAHPTTTQISGLSGSEFQKIYNDLHPVAEELGLFDAGDTQTWKDLATYAEMFMPSSNGGTGVTFNEGMETLNTIMSAGVIGNQLFTELADQCSVSVDTAGTQAIPIACFRQHFRSDMSRDFTNFPAMVQALGAMPSDEYGHFLDDLQASMRKKGRAANAPFTSVEVKNAANFLHYVESIIWRFDADGDGHLSLDEAMTAYPVFKQVLIQASGYSEDSDLQAVYTYLLRYQESPKASVGSALRFVWWKLNKGQWDDVDVDRAGLVAVMARISEAKNSSK